MPEYHKLKSKYNSLLDMFLNKDAIVEATLQPLLRYEIDAAIIFSDILMVPYIMGGTPTFENSGTGPTVKIDFQEKPNFEKTQVIYDSIQEVKSKNSKPLLGFSGGAWSTLLYCLFGANERKIISQKLISEKEKQIKNNINKVTDVIILHAIKQAESGIDAFQIFESWSGLLNDEQFEEWCVEPAKKITKELKALDAFTFTHTATRNGEQTKKVVLDNSSPRRTLLKELIENAVSRYRQEFAKHANQPFIRNWPDKTKTEGWFVSVRRGGFQEMHTHNTAWLSGVFYLQVIENPANSEGAIRFSVDSGRYPLIGPGSKKIVHQPAAGDLVLFPSSLFHGTNPVEQDMERCCVAFDILPAPTSA